MSHDDKRSALRERLRKAYSSRTINEHAAVEAPDLYEVIGILQELDAPRSAELLVEQSLGLKYAAASSARSTVTDLTDPLGEIERVRQACYDAGISCDAVMRLARSALSATSPTIFYMPCAAHQGMTYTLTVPVATPAKQVCPICHPPEGRDA